MELCRGRPHQTWLRMESRREPSAKPHGWLGGVLLPGQILPGRSQSAMGFAHRCQPRRHAPVPVAEIQANPSNRMLYGSLPTVSAWALGLPAHWLQFVDPTNPGAEILAMPIDHDDTGWHSSSWSIQKGARVLSEAEGPSGLRLPLNRLPPSVPRRALSIERNGDAIAIFIPPLLQKPFLELLSAIAVSASKNGIAQGRAPRLHASG